MLYDAVVLIRPTRLNIELLKDQQMRGAITA